MTIIATTTLLILTATILITPLMPKMTKKLDLTRTVKMAFITSTIPMFMTMKYSIQTVSIHVPLLVTNPMTITTSMTMNRYSILFIPAALLVTWSIMEFSPWYVQKTKLTKNFTKYLLIFLIAMLILATAGSLLQLLIGWEGVGIMSFLLINWWFSRSSANSAALQAIIYNRLGDIGLILVMASLATDQTSWCTEQILAMNTQNILLSIGLVLAATGKSAQFFMHLWLPAAMEGPTPVSALLHSSTMVVAGIFLLAQYHPMINFTPPKTLCLYLGVTTSVYAASSALAQYDIKKIIAFSTSSQLGLMMTAIGMNCPNLAIFHMISHATFKATLFLTAGSTIHNTQNEQDIRKMGSIKTTMPITSTAMTINGMALSGLPFLSGFYSKDAIIDALFYSHLNTWAILTTLVSITMTASYTMRMITLTASKTPNHKPSLSMSELNQTKPMIRLTLATIILGPALTTTMLNNTVTLPPLAKLSPVAAMLLGAYLALEFVNHNTTTTKPHNTAKLLNNLAFFKTIHRSIPSPTLNSSYLLSHQLTDLMWLEKSGPNATSTINLAQSKITASQKGLMKNYLMSLLITATILIMMTSY